MAVQGCGMKFIKYSLFVFNLIFWLIGCALLAVGIWFLVDSQQFLKYASNSAATTSSSMILGLGIGVVVIGSVIMITGFLGCCGAMRESECMLASFFSILLIIFAAMVALGVIAIVYKDPIKTAVREVMNAELKAGIQDGVLKWANTKWGCCGIDNEATCKQAYPPTATCTLGSTLCAKGCLNEMWNNLLVPMANGAGIALLVTCGVLIFGMVFAMCLCCKVH